MPCEAPGGLRLPHGSRCTIVSARLRSKPNHLRRRIAAAPPALGASGCTRPLFLDLVEQQQAVQRPNTPLDGSREPTQRDGARRW